MADGKVEITVLVRGKKAVVRKVVRGDDGRIKAKYGLLSAGGWILVAEGTRYPACCELRVADCGV